MSDAVMVSPTFTIGQAIYIAIKPLFKIYLTMALGFLLARKGLLDADTSRTVSKIVLTYLLPCLIFANIVSNIKDTDIKLLGIILLTCYLYFAIGGCWAIFIRLTTPIPRAWFGGLLVATIINNSADLPIAYVQTLGASSQFPSNSASVGTAYSVLYSIGYLSFTFNLGGARLIKWDSEYSGPDKFEATVPPLSLERLLILFKIKSPSSATATSPNDLEATAGAPEPKSPELSREKKDSHVHTSSSSQNSDEQVRVAYAAEMLGRVPSRRSIVTFHEDGPLPAECDVDGNCDVFTVVDTKEKGGNRFTRAWFRNWRHFKSMNVVTLWIANFVEDLFLPQALSIIISIAIAMIPWVKRLFVEDPEQYVKGIPNAPDGAPVLDFFMNFTRFIGETQVQFGLMLLGATIARLRVGILVPGFWKSVVSITLFKLVILPIISIAWVSNLRRMGWIEQGDPMSIIVLIASSATPSATVQCYLTLLHSDPNEPMIQLNSFAIILIVDYIVLPFTMTIAMTYTLMNVL